MNKTLKYISFAMLSALTLTACEEDATLINPSTGNSQSTEDQGEAISKAVFSSEYCPNSDFVIFYMGNPQDENRDPDGTGREDRLSLQLIQPLDHDITLRIGMDQRYIEDEVLPNGGSFCSEYINNFWKKYNIECTPPLNVSNPLFLNGSNEITITIKAGETSSEPIDLFISRELSDWMIPYQKYLIPIQAVETSTGEVYAEIFYIMEMMDNTAVVTGEKPVTMIAYIDTESMNPLIINKFRLSIVHTIREGRKRVKTTIFDGRAYDILNLNTSFITQNNGKIAFSFTSDLLHVLKNNSKYIAPIKKNGIKVCLTIKGNQSGVGFANLTDEQISDFVSQVKVVLDMYDLDGINLWDENAGYDKDGAAPTSGETFAKLIKTMKESMPDKLLTLVDKRESTETLCDPQAGISVGDYIDYAWCEPDKFLMPYETDATLRPLANVPEKKYGSVCSNFSPNNHEYYLSLPKIGGLINLSGEDPITGTDIYVNPEISYYDYNTENWYYEYISFFGNLKYKYYSTDFYDVMLEYANLQYYEYKKDW